MARKGTIGECTPNIDCLLLVNGRPCEYTACTRTEGERGYSANVNRKQASKVLVVVSCPARWRSAPSIGAHTNRSPPPAKAGLCGRAVTNIWAKGTRCLTSWRVNTRMHGHAEVVAFSVLLLRVAAILCTHSQLLPHARDSVSPSEQCHYVGAYVCCLCAECLEHPNGSDSWKPHRVNNLD